MVRHFVELKARLTWNGFRADTQRRVGLPVAILLLGWAGWWLAVRHGAMYQEVSAVDPRAAAEYLGWAALIAFAVWATLPVVIFPLDENLDPQQLTILPISPNQMITGLTAASFVAPSTLVLAAVAVSNASILVDGWWMVIPATAAMAIAFAVGAQLVSASVSAVLRKRRGRDVATLIVFALAGAMFFAYRSIDRILGEDGLVASVLANPILDRAWVLPPVGAQRAMIEAARGDIIAAVAFLVVSVVTMALLAWLWRALLVWMTTTPREGARPASRSRRRGMASGPWGPVFTLARKELRFYVRDPRQRLVWTGTVIFVGLGAAAAVMGSTGLFDISEREWGPLAAPILVLFVGLPIALNLFGWERDAASYLFVLPVRPGQLLLGKDLAVATALVVETAILATILAVVVGSWKWLWLVAPLALAAIGCQLAVGNLVSVVTPLRLPREGTDVFAQSTEQGCLAIASQTISFFAIGLLLVPPVSAVVLTVAFGENLSPLITAGIAIAWGAVFYSASLWISSRVLRRRMPEVLGWVQVT